MSTDVRGDKVETAVLILKRLTAALNTYRTYGPDHPLVRAALGDLGALSTRYLGRHDALETEIGRGSWRFAFDGVERTNDQVTPLLLALHARGVQRLRVEPGATEADLRGLLTMLVLPIEKVRAAGGPAAVLRGRATGAVAVGEISPSAGDADPGGPRSQVPPAAGAILKRFVAAARSTRLYGRRHPIADMAAADLFETVDAALASTPSLRYEIRSGSVFAAGVPVRDDPMAASAFAADCAARQIDSLTFARGLTREELLETVTLFAGDPEALIVEGGFPEALRVRHITHVG